MMSLLRFDFGDDQACLNHLYFDNILKHNCIPVAPDDFNGKVRHAWSYCADAPFPYVTGHMNKSITASIVHMYYMANENFIYSLLKVCPRPSQNMKNYLTKHFKDVEFYEKNINSYHYTEGMEFRSNKPNCHRWNEFGV